MHTKTKSRKSPTADASDPSEFEVTPYGRRRIRWKGYVAGAWVVACVGTAWAFFYHRFWPTKAR